MIERNVASYIIDGITPGHTISSTSSQEREVPYYLVNNAITSVNGANLRCNRFEPNILTAVSNHIYITNYGKTIGMTLQSGVPTTVDGANEWVAQHVVKLLYPLATPVTEIIPASRMPKVPSQYLNAWLEAKDQNGEEIVTDYSIYYEKSIGALLSQIEQALDAAGYPITNYEPEDAMSVAPVLSNDANPVTDAQMAAAVTYGFTLN